MSNTILIELIAKLSSNPEKFFRKPENLATLLACVNTNNDPKQSEVINKLFSPLGVLGSCLVIKEQTAVKALIKAGVRCSDNDAFYIQVAFKSALDKLVKYSNFDSTPAEEKTDEKTDDKIDGMDESFDDYLKTLGISLSKKQKNPDINAKFNKKLDTLGLALGSGWNFNKKVTMADLDPALVAILEGNGGISCSDSDSDSSDDESVKKDKQPLSPFAKLLTLIKDEQIPTSEPIIKIVQFFLCEALIRCDADTYALRKEFNIEIDPAVVTEFAEKSPHCLSDDQVIKVQDFVNALSKQGEIDEATAQVFTSVVRHHANFHPAFNESDYPEELKIYQETRNGVVDCSEFKQTYDRVLGDTPLETFVAPDNRTSALLTVKLYPEIRDLVCSSALDESNLPGFRGHCISLIKACGNLNSTEQFLAESVVALHHQQQATQQQLAEQYQQLSADMKKVQDQLQQVLILVKGLNVYEKVEAKQSAGFLRHTA